MATTTTMSTAAGRRRKRDHEPANDTTVSPDYIIGSFRFGNLWCARFVRSHVKEKLAHCAVSMTVSMRMCVCACVTCLCVPLKPMYLFNENLQHSPWKQKPNFHKFFD